MTAKIDTKKMVMKTHHNSQMMSILSIIIFNFGTHFFYRYQKAFLIANVPMTTKQHTTLYYSNYPLTSHRLQDYYFILIAILLPSAASKAVSFCWAAQKSEIY